MAEERYDKVNQRTVTLRQCERCGHPGGDGACGRMIASDGSVWPARDTGFRAVRGKQ